MWLLRGMRDSFRGWLRQLRNETPGQHHGSRSIDPGGRYKRPKRKRIGSLKKTAECLERGHRLQIDRNLFVITSRRPAMNDFDVETRQVRRRPCCVDHLAPLLSSLELGQCSSPSEIRTPRQSQSIA